MENQFYEAPTSPSLGFWEVNQKSGTSYSDNYLSADEFVYHLNSYMDTVKLDETTSREIKEIIDELSVSITLYQKF
jgi:hypothetical protein